MTTYARSPVMSTWRGLPRVATESVMPLFLLKASKSVAQSAQAVAPCHPYGGNSSTIDDGLAQAARAVFVSHLFIPSLNRFTVSMTSVLSDATAGATARATAKATMIVRMMNLLAQF